MKRLIALCLLLSSLPALAAPESYFFWRPNATSDWQQAKFLPQEDLVLTFDAEGKPKLTSITSVSGGDVLGPSSSVIGRIATFSNSTGKRIQDSGYLITDLFNASNINAGTLANARLGPSVSLLGQTVDLSELQQVSSGTLLGRYSSGDGAVQSLVLGPEFSASSGTLGLANSYIQYNANIDDLGDNVLANRITFQSGFLIGGPATGTYSTLVDGDSDGQYEMDLSKYGGRYTAASGNVTLEFVNSPHADQAYPVILTAAGAARTFTFPEAFDVNNGALTTSVTVPQDQTYTLRFLRDGSRWLLSGKPAGTSGTGGVYLLSTNGVATGLQNDVVAYGPSWNGSPRVTTEDAVYDKIESITAQQLLTALGTTQGTVLVRGLSGWLALGPGSAGQVLTSQGAGSNITWSAPTGGGDVSADNAFGTNESVIVADGTAKKTKASPVRITNAGVVTGISQATIETLITDAIQADNLVFKAADGADPQTVEFFVGSAHAANRRVGWHFPDAGANIYFDSGTMHVLGETNTQTVSNKTILGSDNVLDAHWAVACSDETTAITTGTGKVTFRMPFAMTLTAVRASVTTAPTGQAIIIDVNETGSGSIFSTRLSIDATAKTSTTSGAPAVISDTTLADDAEITVDFDQVGSGTAGAGVKLTFIGTR